MASQINPSNIDSTFPIAGQDNDTQGFRTNYINIKNNLQTAALEITALQANTAGLATSVSSLQTATVNVVNYTTPPTLANSVGTAGQISFDASHIYVCVAANTWVRGSLTTF